MGMRKTDIVAVRTAVKNGDLKIVTQNGFFFMEDTKSGERVRLNETDAIHVVRCKDCKHRYYNEDSEEYCCEVWGDGFDTFVNQDEFCSRGERKDDD